MKRRTYLFPETVFQPQVLMNLICATNSGNTGNPDDDKDPFNT